MTNLIDLFLAIPNPVLMIAAFLLILSYAVKKYQEDDDQSETKQTRKAQPTQPEKPAPNPIKEARNALQIAKLEKQLATAQAQNIAYQEKIQKLSPDWAKAAKNKAQINAYKTRIDANNLVMDKIIDLQVAKQEYDG